MNYGSVYTTPYSANDSYDSNSYEIDPFTGKKRKKKVIEDTSQTTVTPTPSSFSNAAIARRMRNGE